MIASQFSGVPRSALRPVFAKKSWTPEDAAPQTPHG
jgi:hypothetical protein